MRYGTFYESWLNSDKEVNSFERHIKIFVENFNSVGFIDGISSRPNYDNKVHSFGRPINILAEKFNSVKFIDTMVSNG